MNTPSPHSTLETIRTKLAYGQRLSAHEGEFLFSPEVDLHLVGYLADLVRQRKNRNRVWYNINSHLNPTNVCIHRCELCAYSCDPDDAKAYVMSDEEILAAGQEAVDAGATEIHVVGGVHPDKPFDWYLGIIDQLHRAYPRLHLKAWTPVEIVRFAELTARPVKAVLEELIAIGLGSLPGGGAEIFDAQIRRQIAPNKADAETWLDVHRTAHQLGIRTNATMLYGHLEEPRHRVDHLIRLRELQDDTGGFQTFIPLAFHPAGTKLAHLPGPTGLDDLRTMAVSRLMLDNFDHLKAYWISLGVGTAQTALAYGADDLDGTVRQEKIHHDACSKAPEALTVSELRGLITESGREPAERDTLYRPIRRNGADWEVETQ
jgi:aminodeoxyfutalosine synthase